MNRFRYLAVLALGAALSGSAAVAVAQNHDPDHDQDHPQQNQRPDQRQGNQQNQGRDQRPDQRQNQNANQRQGYQQNQGRADYHFRPDDRNNLRGHYQSNLRQWQNNPRRPRFNAGDRLPANYVIQAVPSSYYRGVPPPPPGYRFGYYGGYVVAYDPTTRIIADVLDLVAGQ